MPAAFVLSGGLLVYFSFWEEVDEHLPELLLPQEPERKYIFAFFFGDLIFFNF